MIKDSNNKIKDNKIKDNKTQDKRENSRSGASFRSSVKVFLFFGIYIMVLAFIGVQMISRSGETTKRKVSIHREATPKNADADQKGAEKTGKGNTEDHSELTHPAEMKKVASVPIGQDDYNGIDLKDNGMPYAIKINRKENIVTVYSLDTDGGYTVPVKAFRCSVSLDDTTPAGLFTTTEKRLEWAILQGNVYGQYAYQIHEGIYFHSVPYTEKGSDKLETWEYNKLGEGASLGCIRMCVADVKWIYENCMPGTQVYLFDSDYPGPLGRPQRPYVFTETDETGWDPTDTTPGNPFAGTAAIYGAVSHSIEVGEPFDSKTGVLAFSSDMENVTDRLMVEGTVDNRTPGEYKLSYYFYDNGQKILRDIYITVKDTEPPVITEAPDELHLRGYHGDADELAALIARNVTAFDGDKQIISYDVIPQTEETGTDDDRTTENPVLVIDLTGVQETLGTYEVSCYARDTADNRSAVWKITIALEE